MHPGSPLANIIITARKRRFGEGNVFKNVCHSLHRGVSPRWTETSLDRKHPPPGQRPPQQRTPPRSDI